MTDSAVLDTAVEPLAMRAVLIDDHPLLQAGLKALLERAGLWVALADLGASPDPGPTADLVAWVADQQPRCAVVDLGLPVDGGGLSLIEPLATRGIRVVVLTGETDTVLWGACIRAGAEVVLSKTEPLDEIVTVIGQVCRGESVRLNQKLTLAAEAQRLEDERRRARAPFDALTRRERGVLAALMDGLGPNEIATRDYVSIQTVRTQIKMLLRKLGATSQLEAVALARSARWEPAPADQG